jgi:4-hydroxythreonine-4-phosphate dehydrogenase
MTPKPRLALTVGDPAGIGPEVAAKALADPEILSLADFVVFGDRRLWLSSAGESLARFKFNHTTIDRFCATASPASGVTLVEFPALDYAAMPLGRITPAAGEASIQYLLAAIAAIQSGRLDGVVTGPISKEAIHLAGYPWPGHTELFAEKFAAPEVAMMFAGGPFRVVLVTIHVSLADVLKTLSTEGILRTIRLADAALKKFFAIKLPRLGVCGLNPHAGEGGRFGFEEREIIDPALAQAREEGLAVFGPLPADTIFRSALQGKFDLVVAMYHDQGLIPIKTIAFEESVNITIGLPTIRTSVDHGTAFDLAGQGQANPASMKSAIRMAVRMVEAGRP